MNRVWRAKTKLLAAQMDIAMGRIAAGGRGEGMHVKGETCCSALEQKSAWVPSLYDECCAGVDPSPISCRDHVVALLPPTHDMEGTFNQVLA